MPTWSITLTSSLLDVMRGVLPTLLIQQTQLLPQALPLSLSTQCASQRLSAHIQCLFFCHTGERLSRGGSGGVYQLKSESAWLPREIAEDSLYLPLSKQQDA